jgi:hypothetical protein
MQLGKALLASAAILGASLCSGCGVPQFDVPTDSAGQPTVYTITQRIQCELRDMVRDDTPDDPASFHRLFLLNGDYDVEIALSLEVNNTGGLAPNFSYTSPIPRGTFLFNANGTLSESRDHNFTENISYSLRQIYVDWKTNANPHDCPAADTNLAGTLGIKDFVAMAAITQGISQTRAFSDGGVFGGSIQFLVTKNISALGPTWTLVHFIGPGPFGSLSQVNTDKITLAFAQGDNVGKRMVISAHGFNPVAHGFLQQLLTSGITSQLNAIQNSLPLR